ncbi:alpha/beta hydrolase [Streptomyces goshikiensis]|uniref:alpha/beta fold hydrolase n=1 Tax=Streptomyces TaxID=1883 RepID=UPI00064CFDB1|nr:MULTISPECIES: alpha/beta hydrolase [Streptomyces]AKL66435.1 alpha/beta hydrolase [Streptomyces sp. Mg1]RPK50942.1 Haloalkane dehalogenase [Streptomyces sp. ADI91-18]WBY20547.1 alpha/beta hydrolase [Streptomyces goshikiensis]WSR99323.1 alpha/beta hydrolase [Streptomyces goshikiensis]WSX99653.1 alpha/beta hydrolase [Streptomyces goshikiensis]
MTTRTVRHQTIEVAGVRVAYRESGPADAPVLLLLHGFPTSSHQFARLMDALGDTPYRLIAPDYPGFGRTEAPPAFTYTFDRLADVVEGFTDALGLDRFALYVFDYGAPVGLRVATRRPERVTGLIVQNGNAYEEGLSDAARAFAALRREVPGDEEKVRDLFSEEGVRFQYETGVADQTLVSPDGRALDLHYLGLPGRAEAQADLTFDYASNFTHYPAWQAWLRSAGIPVLVLWGAGDPFFTTAGAKAYLRDVPDAELHLFEGAGHFALETHLDRITPLIANALPHLTNASTAEAEVHRRG